LTGVDFCCKNGLMRTHGKSRPTIAGLAALVILGLAGPVYANPLGFHPANVVGLIVVVIASLLLEVFVTAGVLLFVGIAVVPMAFALVLANLVSYVGVALPLYDALERVWPVEIVVVGIEAILIKVLSAFDLFQGDSFDGLKWRVAFLAAVAGNASSYYVATLLASS